MASIFDNPAATLHLAHVFDMMHGKLVEDNLESMAAETLSDEGLQLLHQAGVPKFMLKVRGFDRKKSGLDLIEDFNRFLDSKYQELGQDYLKVFADSNYQSAINEWSEHLRNAVAGLELKAKFILIERIKAETDRSKKFFLKASLDLITEPLAVACSNGLISYNHQELGARVRKAQLQDLQDYVTSLPLETLVQILKQCCPENEEKDSILIQALLKRKDYDQVIENLRGFSHYINEPSKALQVLSMVFNIRNWKKLDRAKLIDLIAETLDPIMANCSYCVGNDYPEFSTKTSFRNQQNELESKLSKKLPAGILAQAVEKLIKAKPYSSPAKIVALRYLTNALDLDTILESDIKPKMISKEASIELCQNILANSGDTETNPAGLVAEAIIILSCMDRQDLIMEAIQTDLAQHDGGSYILELAANSLVKDPEKLEARLLREIPSLKEELEKSAHALDDHPKPGLDGQYSPYSHYDYPEPFLMDTDGAISLITILNEGEESETFNENAAELLAALDQGAIDELVDLAESNKELSEFFTSLNMMMRET
ncbi:MAG: hypothetical protein OXU45_07650 [Candidatus Melainabacteria bacterium]|nr:hypothetical protein [Candidatus Melainabacteria bacterium]